VAVDGRDALDRLHEATPDIVLTDLAMPRLGGRELLDRLRADPALQGVPVVAVSGWPASFEGRGPAFDGHLDKPFDLQSLSAVLRRVIRRHLPVFRRQHQRLRATAARQRQHCQTLRELSAMVVKEAAAARARGRALFATAA
jgi:CheY-like chemotaxis protein